jgi:hypothetical protein
VMQTNTRTSIWFVLSFRIAEVGVQYAGEKYGNWAFSLLSLTRVPFLSKMRRYVEQELVLKPYRHLPSSEQRF